MEVTQWTAEGRDRVRFGVLAPDRSCGCEAVKAARGCAAMRDGQPTTHNRPAHCPTLVIRALYFPSGPLAVTNQHPEGSCASGRACVLPATCGTDRLNTIRPMASWMAM